jgi:hypothetical protein
MLNLCSTYAQLMLNLCSTYAQLKPNLSSTKSDLPSILNTHHIPVLQVPRHVQNGADCVHVGQERASGRVETGAADRGDFGEEKERKVELDVGFLKVWRGTYLRLYDCKCE